MSRSVTFSVLPTTLAITRSLGQVIYPDTLSLTFNIPSADGMVFPAGRVFTMTVKKGEHFEETALDEVTLTRVDNWQLTGELDTSQDEFADWIGNMRNGLLGFDITDDSNTCYGIINNLAILNVYYRP